MALLFAESFEQYSTDIFQGRIDMAQGAWDNVPSGSRILATDGVARTGNKFFEATQANLSRVQFRNTLSNEIGAAVGMYIPSMPASTNEAVGFAITDEVNSTICNFLVEPNGSVAIYRGARSNNILLAQTDAGLITASAWHHIEVRVLQDNIVGEIELRINGEIETLLTNIELGTVLPRFWMINGGSSTFPKARYYDDLILWDTTGDVNNTFFGPARVTTIWPAADEPGNQWSVTGAATGAAAMSETAPNGDTSYISAAPVGAKSEFTLSTLPDEAEAIAGIYVPAMAKLASAGVGDMRTAIVSGVDVENGPIHNLTAAYTYRGVVYEKDPATGALWTKSGLQAARLRFEKMA